MNKKDIHNNLLSNAEKAGIQFLNKLPPTDGWFDSEGLRLHYLDWGDKSNPVCILLHGFA